MESRPGSAYDVALRPGDDQRVFGRLAPMTPVVEREFTAEGCCVDRVRWFDVFRGEVVEAIILSSD